MSETYLIMVSTTGSIVQESATYHHPLLGPGEGNYFSAFPHTIFEHPVSINHQRTIFVYV